MKTTFYKLVFTFLFSIIILVNQAFSAGGLIHEDCSTGIYSANYGATCNTCGYFNDLVNRLYLGQPKDFWDYYNNISNTETVFSNTSLATVIDFGSYLNEESLSNLGPTSNWVPSNSPDYEPIIFFIDNLSMISTPASRNTPVGRIEYLIRGAAVDNSGTISLNSSNWRYLQGFETQNADLTWNLLANTYVSDGAGIKKINGSSIFEHKECYVMLPAWCGDGIIDSAYGETCDPADTTKSGWGDLGCSATCSPLNSTSSGGGGGGGGGSGGGGGGSNICGDGTLQRPNDSMIMEECDFGGSSPWTSWPNWCGKPSSSNACKVGNLTLPGGTIPEITIPGDGVIKFGPQNNIIIGEGMNPYDSVGMPYIQNQSDYDFYFDKLCVAIKDGNTLSGTDSCVNLGQINSGQTKSFPLTPNIIGNTSILSSNINYGDNRLVATLEHNGTLYSDAYFVGPLNVRVSKPSIANLGGGDSFLKNTNGVSNISETSEGILNSNENKNFVGAGISLGNTSSYSKNINDSESVSEISKKGEKFEEDINIITNESGVSNGNISILSTFENYNGLDNVFILKNKNLIVGSDLFSGLSGPRTYIIENGDLKINTNINYSDNIAFVVKGGNIIVDKDVKKMNGTYISIKKDFIGGNFRSRDGEKTLNQLLITGNIYGNINDLVSKRTYIKQNAGQLNVGTIVSFGSSLFKKPAPLLATFVDEYLESQKIAK